jgi:hypothetical protein
MYKKILENILPGHVKYLMWTSMENKGIFDQKESAVAMEQLEDENGKKIRSKYEVIEIRQTEK